MNERDRINRRLSQIENSLSQPAEEGREWRSRRKELEAEQQRLIDAKRIILRKALDT